MWSLAEDSVQQTNADEQVMLSVAIDSCLRALSTVQAFEYYPEHYPGIRYREMLGVAVRGTGLSVIGHLCLEELTPGSRYSRYSGTGDVTELQA